MVSSTNNQIIYNKAFDNIFIIDPNKVINKDGFAEERNVPQEDLVMYANLQCNLQPRSRLLVGENSQSLETVNLASVNFLKPNNQDYLTTNWTGLQSDFANPKVINSELLGITNISYVAKTQFNTTINITMEDIRGRALFESGDDSIYSAFFNQPPPEFFLTLKGYYGKAVKYPLFLQKFTASLDQTSGNFIINCTFVSNVFNVSNDVTIGELKALPLMYQRQVNEAIQTETSTTQQASVDQLNGGAVKINSYQSSEGRDIINQVYDRYKQLNLIDKDFPNLTILELISRLESFEKKYQESLGQVSTQPITDAKQFDSLLTNFAQEIFFLKNPLSWKDEYLETKDYYIVIDKGVLQKVYTYNKNTYNNLKFDDALAKLNSIIEKNNKLLEDAPTFGVKGGTGNRRVAVNIKNSNIVPNPYYLSNSATIDVIETTKERFGTKNPSNSQLNIIANELKRLDETRIQIEEQRAQSEPPKNPVELPFFFRFDGEGFFLDEINKAKKALTVQVQDIEKDIAEKINEILKSDAGIGFEPTIRNIFAVILASTDGFLRLLDKVHVTAFNERDNPRKKKVVSNDVKQEPNSPVYPWPEYAKEILVDGEPKYDLRYPGDPDLVQETGANDYQIWPEVQFVEEFQKAYIERLPKNINNTPEASNANAIKRLLIAAFSTPNNNAYSFLQISPFLFEMWERIQAISHYQGFVRLDRYETILNFLEAFEATNIKIGIGQNSTELTDLLKEYGFNAETFVQFLASSSPKSYELLLRGQYTTTYLKEELQNNSKFISQELPPVDAAIETESDGAKVEETMNKYLQSTDKNSLFFTDILPFASKEWNKDNLYEGNSNNTIDKVFRTNSSIFYNSKTKKIVNYTSDFTLDGKGDNDKNRPFNYFVSTSSVIDYNSVSNNMVGFFNTRVTQPKKSSYTEGRIDNLFCGDTITSITSSMLNTPFFIRAIQQGVNRDRSGDSNPYLEAGYFFLNSLPLTNLKWPYRNSDDTTNNYLGPCFTKYGAVHSVPKMWAAKIGSVWHRYKTWINTGNDILSGVTGNFDQNVNYDPVNSDPTRAYEFTSNTGSYRIVLTDSIVDSNLYTNDVINVGFYPAVLNDFFYFLNGRNLYTSNDTLEVDIQAQIDSGDLVIITNSLSQISKEAGYDTNNPLNWLFYSTYSILFRNVNPAADGNILNNYYSAPSFGSVISQVKYECFSSNSLVKPVVGNQNVYNGSVRFLWGGTHFGYFPTINRVSPPDQYISWTRNDEWSWHLFLNTFGESGQLDYIEDLFGTFSFEELNAFETEYLNFCKSEKQTVSKFNIQTILKNSIQVNRDDFWDDDPNALLNKFQRSQQVNFNSNINTFINDNVLYQKGNPTNFDYSLFSYFSANPLKGVVDDVAKYQTTNNAVPTTANTQSFLMSKETYPEAWRVLETYVGFSSLSGVGYFGDSSTVTDFFPDFDIAFTSENITRFAPVIKIYSTQKYLGNVTNKDEFVVLMSQFIDGLNSFRNIFFNGVYNKIQNVLGNAKTTTKIEDNSKTSGVQSKTEYYYTFKSVNDKWISAKNYNKDTLFQDILFLDRGSRDLGGQVIVDVFWVSNYLKDGEKKSVHEVLNEIAVHHRFLPFYTPSYLNFYGANEPGSERNDEDENSAANSIFGVFKEVDTYSSRQKMICFYEEVGSEHLASKNIKSGYKDDSWNLEQPTNNPVVENLSLKQEKNDWSKSNKAAGLIVDFGVQNQSIFQTIQVSQDIGKATSESFQANTNLANVLRGTNTYTQNVSLFNVYKTRSYQATITLLGNVMVQPMMYFVLRNMPLFAGSYLITQVEHVVTPSNFTTKITGTRQKLNTLPIKNKLMETIKSQFVAKLLNDLETKRTTQKQLENNTIQARNGVTNNISNNFAPTQNPICQPSVDYSSFSGATSPSQQSIPVRNMFDSILDKVRQMNSGSNSADTLTYIVHTLFYIKSYKNTSFNYYGNNPAYIPISPGTPKWGGNLGNYLSKEFMCLTGPSNTSESYAVFPSLDNAIEFTTSKYELVFNEQVKNVEAENIFVTGFTKTWIEKFPYDKTSSTSNLYETFKSTNPGEYSDLESKVRESYKIVRARLT
jgi:hypothetical protein